MKNLVQEILKKYEAKQKPGFFLNLKSNDEGFWYSKVVDKDAAKKTYVNAAITEDGVLEIKQSFAKPHQAVKLEAREIEYNPEKGQFVIDTATGHIVPVAEGQSPHIYTGTYYGLDIVLFPMKTEHGEGLLLIKDTQEDSEIEIVSEEASSTESKEIPKEYAQRA